MSTPSRSVRVFLSSTFRDFAEERDLLVRSVFPELRRRARERNVEVIDVDLRWGITPEQAERGEVLPICLAEIDRARPYFFGFIGDRYGWVPEQHQYDRSLLVEQPWLEEHRGGKSVTELEMLHGVLNNAAMAGRAFFYFRHTQYSKAKGGAYLSESDEHRRKLELLKTRIRESGFPVMEDYPSPEALAARVQEDLWRVIDEAFPMGSVPDSVTLERMRHEAYAATRCRLYLGGGRYFEALDGAMRKQAFKPVLITGQSGGGKSSLIANWILNWRAQQHEVEVVVHHLGCGADAAAPVEMCTRLMQEIAKITGEKFKRESDSDRELEQLPEWLAKAGAWAQRNEKEVLIVLDGLDKLSDRKHLRWFPRYLPPYVKMVVTCLEGEICDSAMGRMDWLELMVVPLSVGEQKQFIREYLGRYRKSLTPNQVEVIQIHPLSGNPLFLLTVLEELRVFGVHERLESRLQELLLPPVGKPRDREPAVSDVFGHVLARIEEDLGKARVQGAMESLWASRAGLHQDELLDLAQLAPAHWAVIHNALNESLYESGGKINFAHDYLRKAVEDRYGLSFPARRRGLHRKLAQWFETRVLSGDVVLELSWQWRESRNVAGLRRFLLDWRCFDLLQSTLPAELDACWESLGKWRLETLSWSNGRTVNFNKWLPGYVSKSYRRAWTVWQKEIVSLMDRARIALALCRYAGNSRPSVVLAEEALEVNRRVHGKKHRDTICCMVELGRRLHTRHNRSNTNRNETRRLNESYQKALRLLYNAARTGVKQFGFLDPDVVRALGALTALLEFDFERTRVWERAEELVIAAELKWREEASAGNGRILPILQELAFYFYQNFSFEEAMRTQMLHLEFCANNYGAKDDRTIESAINAARIALFGMQIPEAFSLNRKDTARIESLLAGVAFNSDGVYRYKFNGFYTKILGNLGWIYEERENYEEAAEMCEEISTMIEVMYGDHDQRVGFADRNAAELHKIASNFSCAKSSAREFLRHVRFSHGRDSDCYLEALKWAADLIAVPLAPSGQACKAAPSDVRDSRQILTEEFEARRRLHGAGASGTIDCCLRLAKRISFLDGDVAAAAFLKDISLESGVDLNETIAMYEEPDSWIAKMESQAEDALEALSSDMDECEIEHRQGANLVERWQSFV